MREIMFRGKQIDTGEWRYGYLFKIWEQTYILWGTTNGVPNMIEVDPETVGQYTGLKDKNGKEIYDRDLCIDGDGHSLIEIVWTHNHQWGCKIIKGRTLSKGLTFPLFHWDECYHNGFRQLEIIGNIYEKGADTHEST